MTLDEAIQNREKCLAYLEGAGPMASQESTEAVRMSLAALRAQKEPKSPCAACGYGGKHLDAPPCTDCPAHPKAAAEEQPLTLEELRGMDGQPAWFVSIRDGFSCWGIVRVVNMSKVWFIAVGGAERAFGDRDTYGVTWVAYRRPPVKRG